MIGHLISLHFYGGHITKHLIESDIDFEMYLRYSGITLLIW